MSTARTAQVELAYPMTIGGRDYRPDEVVELPLDEDREGGPTARELVRTGRARWKDGEVPAVLLPAAPSTDTAPPPGRARTTRRSATAPAEGE